MSILTHYITLAIGAAIGFAAAAILAAGRDGR
jgi:hypothetical protein